VAEEACIAEVQHDENEKHEGECLEEDAKIALEHVAHGEKLVREKAADCMENCHG